jgi:ribonuclease Y
MAEPAALLIYGILGAIAIALGIGFARRSKQVAELAARLARASSERDAAVRDEVRRRLDAERETLGAELDEERGEIDALRAEMEERHAEAIALREQIDERAANLDGRAEELTERADELDARARTLDEREAVVAGAEANARAKLEEIAGLSTDEARRELLARVESEVDAEVAKVLQKADEQARSRAEERARALTIQAMHSVRGAVAAEGTVSVVVLPSDEMKGRVIGREGRNIRALEQATGVDVLVDDTPQAILISTWNPLRRAIAARAVRKLVEDGRIHPARIEEVVERTREEVDEEAREVGEATAYDLGVTGLHERLVLLLGRLSFHVDAGRSVLDRAKVVATIAGTIADEMRLDGDALRRAGLLHEIARADKSAPVEPTALASADLARRFGETDAVTDPIRALAQPPDTPRTPSGVIMVTATRLAVSRPGARDENLQRFMDRLEAAEAIARETDGVESAVAVRAGRELRVHVRAEDYTDERTIKLARSLAREIERRVDYPGQIRVLVLRETRAVSYAV